jgi:RNA polymerase sigma-70 factor (ECF subfamily)
MTSQPDDDGTVIDRVLGGEKNAYALLMRKYNQRLYRIVRSYLKDGDEIEDVLQGTYIKAYEQLPRFEKRSSFSTWLIRIAINEALARSTHQKRFHSLDAHAADGRAAAQGATDQPATTETPMGILMNTELKFLLEGAVDRLPDKYRSVFVMREIEGMSVAETSASLDITETNVKVRLNRAKGMLRETISGFYGDVEVFHFDLIRCDRIVDAVLRRIGAAPL